MKSKRIKLIAKKLNWKEEETHEAIKKLSTEDSIVKEWNQFFEVCIDSRDCFFRMLKIQASFKKLIKDRDILELVIRNLKTPDPCFVIWALFNTVDFEDYKEHFLWNKLKSDKSFTLKHSREIYMGIFSSNIHTDPFGLTDYFLNGLIKNEDFADARILLLQTVERIGYLAFILHAFSSLASSYSIHPEFSNYEKELAGAFIEKNSQSNNNKQREYWLYFLIIQNLKKELGFKPLCRKIGKRFHVEGTSIERRYFEQKKKADRLGLSNEDIISEYYLRPSLEKHVSEFVSNSKV